jgi:hypothetical protein
MPDIHVSTVVIFGFVAASAAAAIAAGSSIPANIIVNAAIIGENITYCNAPYFKYHKKRESY